jgi:hypothetical protein
VATAADRATGEGEILRTGDDTYERLHHAPVIKETIRDEYQHNVQPVIQEEHDRTDIIKTVQPLKDNEVKPTEVHSKQRTDQFREVGADARLAAETEEKLRLHREEVAAQGGRVHLGDTHEFIENAPQVSHTERRHVIEEVQPVVERDVLRPHVVEEKQNIFVHHKEAPVLHEVRVAPTMTVQEWERTQASKGTTFSEERLAEHTGLGVHGRDRNHDGIPDSLQCVGGARDRNHDGIPDSQQRGVGVVGRTEDKVGLNRDRDHDGIPDRLEGRGLGSGVDRNGDGIPDRQQQGGVLRNEGPYLGNDAANTYTGR